MSLSTTRGSGLSLFNERFGHDVHKLISTLDEVLGTGSSSQHDTLPQISSQQPVASSVPIIGYGRKTYLPQLALDVRDLGRYIVKHHHKIYETIDTDTDLTAQERQQIKEVLEIVIKNQRVFDKLVAKYRG